VKQVEAADYKRPAVFMNLAVFDSARARQVVLIKLPPLACSAMHDTFIMLLLENFGWVAVNILIPVALPFAVLAWLRSPTAGGDRFAP